MTDKLIALIALLMLTATLGVIAVFVPSPDLVIVIVIGLAMAFYDFGETLFGKKRK